jgi:hypothetical protein
MAQGKTLPHFILKNELSLIFCISNLKWQDALLG